MNWLVYHLVSGQAFFTGVLLLIIAALADGDSRPVIKRLRFLVFFVGLVAVVVSSTAIPDWVGILATEIGRAHV